MAYVKLDCGLLNSTLWVDRDAREVFVTALLMAAPGEIPEPTPQLDVRSLTETGWVVPAGWYGIVPAAGVGIVRQSGLDPEAGLNALERLGLPEPDSRSRAHDGRRLVRIDGGYVVLNYMAHRDRDHTAATRSKRYRDRKLATRVASQTNGVATRNVTQAEAEAEAKAEAKARTTTYYSALTDFPAPFVGIPHEPAVHSAIRASPNPTALIADLLARVSGTPGHQPATPAELGQALHEMAVAGAPVTARALSRFVDGVRQGHSLPPRPASAGRDFEAERVAQEEARVRRFLASEGSP